MNTRRLAITTALALGVTLGAAGVASAATSVSVGLQIGSRSTVDIGFFYSNLEPYGRWVQRPSYGRVYFPRVASSWRPYSQGYWVDTDYGWTWVSEEPFGWATYHYGRWYEDDDYGWGWVPDDEWGPAWVDFQQGNGYVGWAPLPPTVRINYSSGYYPRRSYASYDDYCFVEERRFLEPRVSSYFVPRTRNRAIYGSTRNVTRYNVVNNRFVNRSVEVDHIQRVTGRRVQRYQVTDVRDVQQRPRFRGNQVEIFRPRVERRAQRQQAVAVQQQQQRNQQRRQQVAVQQQQQRVEQQRREVQVREQRGQRSRQRQQQIAAQQQQQRQVAEQRQVQNRQRQQQRLEQQRREVQVREQRAQRSRQREQQIAAQQQQQRQVAEQRQSRNQARQQQRLEQQRRETQVRQQQANRARQREQQMEARAGAQQQRRQAAQQQRQQRREAQSQRPPRGNRQQGDRPPHGNRHREGQGGN